MIVAHDPRGRLQTLDSAGRLTDRSRESLRAAIIDGRLVPGGLDSVAELAADLGVSRTPVREGLVTLERERMVRFERNRGFRVLQTSIHDLQEIFPMRLLLEVPSTYLATEEMRPEELERLRGELEPMRWAAASADEPALWHHDRRFHVAIHEASGNRRARGRCGSATRPRAGARAVTAPLSRTLLRSRRVRGRRRA